jgi:hypothetical protein
LKAYARTKSVPDEDQIGIGKGPAGGGEVPGGQECDSDRDYGRRHIQSNLSPG